MKRTIFLLILIIGGVILLQKVLAQGTTIAVSPVTFELTGGPGDIITNQLKVSNPSDNMIRIKMEVEDIAPAGEMGQVVVEPAETETYSLAIWTKIEPEEFTLEPKEQKSVSFTISIPENAEPGGHYGTVLAGTSGVVGPKTTGTAIVQKVGVLVLLIVPGEMKESLTVKDFSAPPYSEYGPIPFVIRFENKGTVHVKPSGSVTVTNWLGRKVSDVGLPSRNILPNSVRKFEISLNKKWLWAGKYTATLTGSYGISNTLLVPTVISFWAFPWKVGVVILVLIILFILSRKRWMAAFKVLIKGEKT